MEVIHLKCTVLDVHQKTVVECIRLAVKKKVEHEVRTFGTTTSDLLALSDWGRKSHLLHQGVAVGHDGKGVYMGGRKSLI